MAIKKAERMYCEIKDIRDELNILKSAVQHQRTVEAGLHRRSLDGDLTAAYIVNDLKEMDNSAERIQSAVSPPLVRLINDAVRTDLCVNRSTRLFHFCKVRMRIFRPHFRSGKANFPISLRSSRRSRGKKQRGREKPSWSSLLSLFSL